ncbi:MAG: hypothetical protein WBD76_10730, partial [Methyloceanibacter sp.]
MLVRVDRAQKGHIALHCALHNDNLNMHSRRAEILYLTSKGGAMTKSASKATAGKARGTHRKTAPKLTAGKASGTRRKTAPKLTAGKARGTHRKTAPKTAAERVRGTS